MNELISKVGIELLGQLKKTYNASFITILLIKISKTNVRHHDQIMIIRDAKKRQICNCCVVWTVLLPLLPLHNFTVLVAQ